MLAKTALTAGAVVVAGVCAFFCIAVDDLSGDGAGGAQKRKRPRSAVADEPAKSQSSAKEQKPDSAQTPPPCGPAAAASAGAAAGGDVVAASVTRGLKAAPKTIPAYSARDKTKPFEGAGKSPKLTTAERTAATATLNAQVEAVQQQEREAPPAAGDPGGDLKTWSKCQCDGGCQEGYGGNLDTATDERKQEIRTVLTANTLIGCDSFDPLTPQVFLSGKPGCTQKLMDENDARAKAATASCEVRLCVAVPDVKVQSNTAPGCTAGQVFMQVGTVDSEGKQQIAVTHIPRTHTNSNGTVGFLSGASVEIQQKDIFRLRMNMVEKVLHCDCTGKDTGAGSDFHNMGGNGAGASMISLPHALGASPVPIAAPGLEGQEAHIVAFLPERAFIASEAQANCESNSERATIARKRTWLSDHGGDVIDGFYSKLFTVTTGAQSSNDAGHLRMVIVRARADHFHSSGVSVVAMPGAANKATGGANELLLIPIANLVHSAFFPDEMPRVVRSTNHSPCC
jgi:hypothetical protein